MQQQTARFLTTADVAAAAHCLTTSFTNAKLSRQDLSDCRKIENGIERAKEISRRLSVATKGKITELSQAGNPLEVLLCLQFEECLDEMVEDVELAVSYGMAVGLEDPNTKQLFAILTAHLFDPIEYLSKPHDLANSSAVTQVLSGMKSRFSRAFLLDPKFVIFRHAPVQQNSLFGILPSHRGLGAQALCDQLNTLLSQRSRELGVGFTFTIVTNPRTHHMCFDLGRNYELAFSQHLPSFVDARGNKPFEAIFFKSDYPGADSTALFLWDTHTIARNSGVAPVLFPSSPHCDNVSCI